MAEELIPRASNIYRDATIYSLLPLWLDNLAENLPKIRTGLDAYNIPKRNNPAIVIGAGPSLSVYKHLQLIKRAGWKHTILICDKKLDDALRMGIIPAFVATVDGSPTISNFYNRRNIKSHAKHINAVFSGTTHPSVVQTWMDAGGAPWWFTPAMDDVDEKGKLGIKSLTVIMFYLTKQKGIISGVGNVGAFLWNLAAALHCSPIILVGLDFSEQVHNKAEAIYFNFYMRNLLASGKISADQAAYKAALLHQQEINPDFVSPFTKLPYYKKGEPPQYLVNPIWKMYRDSLAAHIVTSKIHTINATGNGCIHTQAKNEHGDFILNVPNFEAMPLEEAIKKYA